jgi:hypothetical protein
LIGFTAEYNRFRARYRVLQLQNLVRGPSSSSPDPCGSVDQLATA